MAIARHSVLVLGEPLGPAFEQALFARGLTPTNLTVPSDDDFRSARAAIFNARGLSVGSVKAPFDSFGLPALVHGLQIVIRLEGDDNRRALQSMYPEWAARWIFFDPVARDLEDLAELVRGHDPGPAESPKLIIPSMDPPLSGEDQILLRRAFTDCDELILQPITEGRSNARVLRAHAKRAGADPPAFLLPF